MFIIKIFKWMGISILILLVILSFTTLLFVQQDSFGNSPEGTRLEKVKKSANYKDGIFVNRIATEVMSPEASYFQLLKKYTWKDTVTEPGKPLPSVHTNLKTIVNDKPTITWFGHSTFLIQLKNKTILSDPIFSERASPVQFAGSKNYEGTAVYTVDDLPAIDIVVISHDHYDHLDYGTIQKLKPKVKMFYVPLGVGSHLESWGIPLANIKELDWWEGEKTGPDFEIIATPARHFSGRGLTDRNKTLWASYVVLTPEARIYIGGDSGYGDHFKEIGEKFGPFDIVFLESGQYHKFWPFIHMMPEQTVQASLDLKGKVLFPVHWGKFTLALHAWNEPVERVLKKAQELNVKITTPLIGEQVLLDSLYPDKKWWRGL